MNLAWALLICAGLFEIGWPLGLKNGYTESGMHWGWIGFACICMVISGSLLFYAQKTIPIGTAYAVWTGIGAVGTFTLGVILFGDALNTLRLMSALLIVTGVIGLKIAA
ncbi:MAG: DMT family transporter [Alphaproteobacteria bacterium]